MHIMRRSVMPRQAPQHIGSGTSFIRTVPRPEHPLTQHLRTMWQRVTSWWGRLCG